MNLSRQIFDRLKENEETARKFNEIEASILNILNFQDFLEKLLFEISDKFSVPYIWITIIEGSRISGQLSHIQNSDLLKNRTTFIPEKDFLNVSGKSLIPILANRELSCFDAFIPKEPKWKIGSLAIAPITLDGQIIGSINQADQNIKRFEPGIDTSLLEQLALKVSLCLSNVTAHEQLKYLAYHDPLTGLLNRRVMERILEREFNRAMRYNLDLTLLFIDIDDFKSINDTFGHDVGDAALCHVADCLTRIKRDSDIAARFAGDEFLVILPSTTQPQAEYYIARVKETLKKSPLPVSDTPSEEHLLHIRLSHGTASASNNGPDSPKDFLKTADNNLYKAKNTKHSR